MGMVDSGTADGDDAGNAGRAEEPMAEEAGKRRERMGAEMRKVVALLGKAEPAAVIDGLQRLHAHITKHGAKAVEAYVRVAPPDWLQMLQLWDGSHRRGGTHQVAIPLMALLADILSLSAHTPRLPTHTPSRPPPSALPPVLGAPLPLPQRIEALARALLTRCCRKGGIYPHLSSPFPLHVNSALRLLLALSLVSPPLTRFLLLSFDFSLPALPSLSQPPAAPSSAGSRGKDRGERGKQVGAHGGVAAVFWSGTPAVVVGGEEGEQGGSGMLEVCKQGEGEVAGACEDVGVLPPRVLMAEWVVACLAMVDASMLTQAIVALRHQLAGILWHLASDHPVTAGKVLWVLQARVMAPSGNVPRGLQGALFGESALEQMARVAGRGEGTGEAGGSGARSAVGVAAGMAVEVLRAVCTDSTHGVLPGGAGGVQGGGGEGVKEGGDGEDVAEEGMGGREEGEGTGAEREREDGMWGVEASAGGTRLPAAAWETSSHWSGGMDRLIRLARGLQVLQCAAHRMLLLGMARACPPLAAAYLQNPPFSLQPMAHTHWFTAMAIVARLVRIASSLPLLSLSSPFSLHPPSSNVSPLLSRMLPPCLSRPILTRALLHRSPRVRLLALCTLSDCLAALSPLAALAAPHARAPGPASGDGEGAAMEGEEREVEGVWWGRGRAEGDEKVGRSPVDGQWAGQDGVASRYWRGVVEGIRGHVVGAVPDPQIVLSVLAGSEHGKDDAQRGGAVSRVRRAGGAGEGGRRKRGRGEGGEWQVMEDGDEGEEAREDGVIGEVLEEGEEEEEEVAEEEEEEEEVGLDDEMDDEEEGGRWSVRVLLHCKALRLLALYQRVVPEAVAGCHVDPLRFIRPDLPSLSPPLLRATMHLLLAFFPPSSPPSLSSVLPSAVPPVPAAADGRWSVPPHAMAATALSLPLSTFPLHNHLLPLMLLRLSHPPPDVAPHIDWLCIAAMLSSHAFDAHQLHAAMWLHMLPALPSSSSSSSSASVMAARGVVSFLANAVACVARAPLKYLLTLPAASPPSPLAPSHYPCCAALNGHKAHMGSLGPFPACILSNCLKLLLAPTPATASSSPSSSSAPVKFAIAVFTCNGLTRLMCQQDCALPLAALITHILRPALSPSSSSPLSPPLLCLKALLDSASSLLRAHAEGQEGERGDRAGDALEGREALEAAVEACEALEAAVEACEASLKSDQGNDREDALSSFTLALSAAHPPSLIALLPRIATLATSLPPPAMPLLCSTLLAHGLLPSVLQAHPSSLLEASALAHHTLLPASTLHTHHAPPSLASLLPLSLPALPPSPNPSTLALSRLLLSLPFAPLLSLCLQALLSPLKPAHRCASCLASLLLTRLHRPPSRRPTMGGVISEGANEGRQGGESSMWGERMGEMGRVVLFELGRVLGVGRAGGEKVKMKGAEWRRSQRCVRLCMGLLDAALLPPCPPAHVMGAGSKGSAGGEGKGRWRGVEEESVRWYMEEAADVLSHPLLLAAFTGHMEGLAGWPSRHLHSLLSFLRLSISRLLLRILSFSRSLHPPSLLSPSSPHPPGVSPLPLQQACQPYLCSAQHSLAAALHPFRPSLSHAPPLCPCAPPAACDAVVLVAAGNGGEGECSWLQQVQGGALDDWQFDFERCCVQWTGRGGEGGDDEGGGQGNGEEAVAGVAVPVGVVMALWLTDFISLLCHASTLQPPIALHPASASSSSLLPHAPIFRGGSEAAWAGWMAAVAQGMAGGQMVEQGEGAGEGSREHVQRACEHMALRLARLTFDRVQAAMGDRQVGVSLLLQHSLPHAEGGVRTSLPLTALTEWVLETAVVRGTQVSEGTALAALEAMLALPPSHSPSHRLPSPAPSSHIRVPLLSTSALMARVVERCVEHPSWRRGNLLALLLAAQRHTEGPGEGEKVAGEVVGRVAEWIGREAKEWASRGKGTGGGAIAEADEGDVWWWQQDKWMSLVMLLPAVAAALTGEARVGEGDGAAGVSVVGSTYRDLLIHLLTHRPPTHAPDSSTCYHPHLSRIPAHFLPSLLSFIPSFFHTLLRSHPLPHARLAVLLHALVPGEGQGAGRGGMQTVKKGEDGKGRGRRKSKGGAGEGREGVLGSDGWHVRGGCVSAQVLLQVMLASRLTCSHPAPMPHHPVERPTSGAAAPAAPGAGPRSSTSDGGGGEEREDGRGVWGTGGAKVRVLSALLDLLGSILPLAPEAHVAVLPASGAGSVWGIRGDAGDGESERTRAGGKVTMTARQLEQFAATHLALVATHLAHSLKAAPPAPVASAAAASESVAHLLAVALSSVQHAAVACLKHRFAHPLCFHALSHSCHALLAAATAPAAANHHTPPAASTSARGSSAASSAAAAVSSVGATLFDLLLAHSRTLPTLLSPAAGSTASPLPALLGRQADSETSRALSLPSPLSLIPAALLPDLPVIASSLSAAPNPHAHAAGPTWLLPQEQGGTEDGAAEGGRWGLKGREGEGEGSMEGEACRLIEVQVQARELLPAHTPATLLWPIPVHRAARGSAGRREANGWQVGQEMAKRKKSKGGKRSGEEGDEEGSKAVQGASRLELLRLMAIFLRMRMCHMSGRVCSSESLPALQALFPLLLSLYNATLSPSDCALLTLMRLLARLGNGVPRGDGGHASVHAHSGADGLSVVGGHAFKGLEWFDFLWGQGAAARWQGQKARRGQEAAGTMGLSAQEQEVGAGGVGEGWQEGVGVGGEGREGVVFEGREQRQWRFWWEEAAVDATRCGLLVLAFPPLRCAQLGEDAGEEVRRESAGEEGMSAAEERVRDVDERGVGGNEWMGYGGEDVGMGSACCGGGSGDYWQWQQGGEPHLILPICGSAAAQDVAVRRAAYDPAFLLPFTLHALSRRLLSPRMAARAGLMAAAIASLASARQSMRRLGYATLALFSALLEEQEEGWREQRAVQQVVRCVRSSITHTWQRLPRLSALFMAEMLQVMHLGGASPLFPLLSQTLLSQPSFNLKSVPLFLPCLFSGSPHHRAQRAWLLQLLAALALSPHDSATATVGRGEQEEHVGMGEGGDDGDVASAAAAEGSGNAASQRACGDVSGQGAWVNGTVESVVVRRCFVAELLEGFFGSGVSDAFTCKLILQALRRLCFLPSYACHLVRQGGVLLWLTAAVQAATRDLLQAQALTAHMALLLPPAPPAIGPTGRLAATATGAAAGSGVEGGRADGVQSAMDILALAVEVLLVLLSCPPLHAPLCSHASPTSHHLLPLRTALQCALLATVTTATGTSSPWSHHLSPSSLGLACLMRSALLQMSEVLPAAS